MSRQIDRRAFLRRGAAGAAALAVGPGLLAACSTDEPRSDREPGSGASARSGGTLRAAFVGGGASETLDFFNGPSALDLVRARAWHGTLGNLDPSGPDGVRYGVLKGIDISDDLSTYTLHVRPGVRFTDGSELTSADVLHSLSALAGHRPHRRRRRPRDRPRPPGGPGLPRPPTRAPANWPTPRPCPGLTV